MNTGLQVTGTVQDSAGQPVGGATVMWAGGPVPLPEVALLTPADGSSVLSAPVAGHYTLRCRSDMGAQVTQDVAVGPQGAQVIVRLD